MYKLHQSTVSPAYNAYWGRGVTGKEEVTCIRKSRVEHCRMKAVSKSSWTLADAFVDWMFPTNSDQAISVETPSTFRVTVLNISSKKRYS